MNNYNPTAISKLTKAELVVLADKLMYSQFLIEGAAEQELSWKITSEDAMCYVRQALVPLPEIVTTESLKEFIGLQK